MSKSTPQKKRVKNLRALDPFLAREQKKYGNPLPSREWIAEVLGKIGIPIGLKDLAIELSINRDELEFFEHRIRAMARDGQAYINRAGKICVADKLALVKCRIDAHKDGFGFAVPLISQPDQKDFVLHSKQMRELMHGDIVVVRPSGFDRKARPECRILEIIERKNIFVVARLLIERGVYIAIPEDKRLTQQIMLDASSCQFDVKNGQVVTVKITAYPQKLFPAFGEIVEILGNYDDSGMEIDIAVRKHNLPHVFSDECLKVSEKLPKTVRKSDLKNRVDLRELNLVTIDGETARDFDDAVFAEKQGRNFRLVVAIADVSHYVKVDNAIDVDAYERATSVYFPRKVIPMLPESLSNGICSLMPEVDRLCMACDILISPTGIIKEYSFYPAVMHSKARLTYTQVGEWLESGERHELKKEIDTLNQLFKVLHKKRDKRGAMEFDSLETQMIFNEDGKIERIEPVYRNDAHRIIEECMLCANVCAANFLLQQEVVGGLFRNHLGPTPEKLITLKEQLSLVGLSLDGADKPTPKDYAKLFEQIKEREDKSLLQTMLLRSMQQAVYAPKNEGHFGLAYEAYTHFTSPIRRYPDLIVHRTIKGILEGKPYKPTHNWTEMATHCSSCERKADEASHDVEKWLKTYYMQDKIGDVFEGSVSGMSSFGLFIMLDNLYIEGMIHISELGQDYYNFRPEIMAIEGERTKSRFKLGDRLIVKVVRADLDTRRIDLLLITGNSETGKRKGTKNASPKKEPAKKESAKNPKSKVKKPKFQKKELPKPRRGKK